VVPGLAGFLVWEFKENWRLYAANRRRDLGPTIVGHHGERMIQFVRWGFRSGTLPKHFAKLRKANRKAARTGNWKASHKHQHAIQAVEEQVRRFTERELVAVLAAAGQWGAMRLAVGEIRVSGNRILIELTSSDPAHESLWLAFTDRSGWLLASVDRPGWLANLSHAQAQALANALAGFYKMAGVDLVREQIESRLPNESYEIADEGLVVWHGANRQGAITLRPGDWPAAETSHNGRPTSTFDPFPPPRSELLFSDAAFSWDRWVSIWEQQEFSSSACGEPRPLLPGVQLLPPIAQCV
jgi:hypothetical protein